MLSHGTGPWCSQLVACGCIGILLLSCSSVCFGIWKQEVFLCAVVAKTFKRSKNSLVWTLFTSQSSKNDSTSVNHRKVYPHLFPWKRTTYWRSSLQNWNLISKSSSLAIRYENFIKFWSFCGFLSHLSTLQKQIVISISSFSGKLLLSRNRDTVYTRSINGFSLRKSKVLSVCGSSLKWSKSMDRHSKKANEVSCC